MQRSILEIFKSSVSFKQEKKMTESVSLNVSGMKCGGCEANVTARLQAIDGVLSVKASSKDKEVDVEFDAARTDLDAITTAITEAGFTVEES
jgi:copper chaperone